MTLRKIDEIMGRLEAATKGTDDWRTRSPLCDEDGYSFSCNLRGIEFIRLAPDDIAYLLDLCAKQGAVVEAVKRMMRDDGDHHEDCSIGLKIANVEHDCDCGQAWLREAMSKLAVVEGK